jgi:hypothetical protein
MDDLPLDKFPALYKQGRQRDDFGTIWHVEQMGICGIPVEWPLPDLSRYGEYDWPEDFTTGPPSGRQYSGHMCGFDDRWYARGAWITFFEQLQQLHSMENTAESRLSSRQKNAGLFQSQPGGHVMND